MHTCKEEGKGERGKKRGRWRRWKVKYSSLFLDAVLPAGPCSLTCWLEERGCKKKKKIESTGRREKKAKATCEVCKVRGGRAEMGGVFASYWWGTMGHANWRTRALKQKQKMDILAHKLTHLGVQAQQAYELQCSCCHGDTLSCWPPDSIFPLAWLLKEMIDKCPNVSRPSRPHRFSVFGGVMPLSLPESKGTCACMCMCVCLRANSVNSRFLSLRM